jgi:glycosyltransferase involved in cell wall biosynthesis
MRIALVVPGGVDRSGEYRVIPALIALIARLARHNELHVYALYQEAEESEWPLEGATIHNVGSRRPRVRAIRAICAAHRQSRFDLIQAIWSGTSGMAAVIAGRLLGVPSAVHIAGGELVALRDIGYGGRLKCKGRVREALVLRAASALTAASAPILASLSDLGVSAQRLPLGVDLKSWPPRRPVRRSDSQLAKLIHVASLNRVKDQATLLRALARLATDGLNFEMEVVGEDTLGGEIQSLSAQLGLSNRVRFRGFLTQRELRPLVEAAHLLVMSSRHEAGPLVVLEAAAVGVPTVGTAVGHIAEWAPHAAIAVPVGDDAALAAAVGGLLKDEEKRLALASEAFERSVSEDADFTAQRFRALHAGLVGTRTPAGEIGERR